MSKILHIRRYVQEEQAMLKLSKLVYDPDKTTYEKLFRLFLEIHDPTQVGGQGPDLGDQYRSEIFYMNDEQKKIADTNIGILKSKGLEGCNRSDKSFRILRGRGLSSGLLFQEWESTLLPCLYKKVLIFLDN